MRRGSASGHRMRLTPIREHYRGYCTQCCRERLLHRTPAGDYRCNACLKGQVRKAIEPSPSADYQYSAAGRRAARIELGKSNLLPLRSSAPQQLKKTRQAQKKAKQQNALPSQKSSPTPPQPDQEWLQRREVIEKSRLLWEAQTKKQT